MEFEWDDQKAKSNLQKYGIDFRDAIAAFFDPYRIETEEETSHEERYRVIGAAHGRVLFVVYTWREDVIRIISARKATYHEREQYYSN